MEIKCEGGIVIKSPEERSFIEIEPDMKEIDKEEVMKRAEYAYSYAVAEKPDENTSCWFMS